jgi:lipopolysaccharide/colanic/teichoic acid biosynthesis glycosyltransferase
MSFVGPRPGLASQTELTNARVLQGVYVVRPGITGLAQVNRIDMSTPELLARTDALMLRNLGIKMYFKYIFITLLGKGWGDVVR